MAAKVSCSEVFQTTKLGPTATCDEEHVTNLARGHSKLLTGWESGVVDCGMFTTRASFRLDCCSRSTTS